MEDIALRITVEAGVDRLPEDVMKYLKSKNLKFLVKEEGKDGDNPHFQGICHANISGMRTWFKRQFDGGNAKWSLKKATDPDGFIQYLSKGKDQNTLPDVRYSEGILNIKERHADYWKLNEELKKGKRTKKYVTGNLLKQCYEDIKDKLHPDTAAINIGVAILQWYSDNELRVPSQFNMGTMVSTYIVWLKKQESSVVEPDLFRRLYPGLGF